MNINKKIGLIGVALLLTLGSGSLYAAKKTIELAEGEVVDATGTDPRDFSDKFMPYWRTTELKDGTVSNVTTAFGMSKLAPGLALTYEVPLFSQLDISDADLYDGGPSKVNGVGDLNVRMLTMLGKAGGMQWLAGAELWFPTHTEDALGNDRATFAPLVANIMDLDMLPMPGAFMAMMHFYEFDYYKGETCNEFGVCEDVDDVSMYKGRWFFMIPINEKYKLYTLTEMQPVYDFEKSHFSFWIAPEFGTGYFGPMIYAKPGWGINPEIDYGNGIVDREFSFEIGMRIMM